MPVVVERAQYWPNPAWHEAHNSFGVTAAATKWGLAEGRVGGPRGEQTYILLANPGTQHAADVTITFLRENGTPVVKTFNVPASSRFNVAIAGPASDVPELIDEVVRRAHRLDAADRRRAIGLRQRERRDVGGRHERDRHAAAVRSLTRIAPSQGGVRFDVTLHRLREA